MHCLNPHSPGTLQNNQQQIRSVLNEKENFGHCSPYLLVLVSSLSSQLKSVSNSQVMMKHVVVV